MKEYNGKTSAYEVFGANMTIDTQSDIYSAESLSMCKSCQCNCHLCRGGRTPGDDSFEKVEVEKFLEGMLAA